MLKMAGAGEEVGESRKVAAGIRARAPWLFATCAGGLLAALAMEPFSELLQRNVAIVLFLPLLLGVSGLAGMQSATILVSSLSAGLVEVKQFWTVLLKELLVGFVLGLVYGVLVGAIAAGLLSLGTGIVVGASVVLSLLAAVLVGSALPLLLERLHLDPTIASGPFVAATVHVLVVLIYLATATALLPYAAG
jgi:magnesium transporter